MALEAALRLADAALRAGDRVGMLVYQREPLLSVPPRRGRAQVHSAQSAPLGPPLRARGGLAADAALQREAAPFTEPPSRAVATTINWKLRGRVDVGSEPLLEAYVSLLCWSRSHKAVATAA